MTPTVTTAPRPADPRGAPVLDAGEATLTALLNCVVRELCAPARQVWPDGDRRLVLRLPHSGRALRIGLARPVTGPTFRLRAPAEVLGSDGWRHADHTEITRLIEAELSGSGAANPEFAAQVRDSHRALTALIRARAASAQVRAAHTGRVADAGSFIESEQSLVAGHRFHPSPKARQGDPAHWLRYAPEARSRFRLHWLAVRDDLIDGEGDTSMLDGLAPAVPAGHRPLPVHPWQFALLAGRPLLRRALADGSIIDLGPAGPEVAPTSSVRTVYVPAADMFCKFSLDVRITNCVRKNAWYELRGAVALNRLLRPVFGALAERFDGCALLGEPGWRSVALADRRLHEGLGVIVREGVAGLRGTPLLAAALADPYALGPAAVRRLPVVASPAGALAWWDRYVHLVSAPVLHAYFAHGVVLESHLQNVLMVLDGAGMPVQAVFRDLEGAKLVAGRWDVRELPPRVRESVTHDAERGRSRVFYCLLVNHLAEVAAAVADLHPELEPRLWRVARARLRAYANEHFVRPPAELLGLLAGDPLPAKANLLARWSRSADRGAGYVQVPNPLGESDAGSATVLQP